MAVKPQKSIHRACLGNLWNYLRGEIPYEEWVKHQDELESRLTPEPELPFEEPAQDAAAPLGRGKQTPERSKAA